MLHVERVSLDGSATQLNKYALNHNSQKEDDDEPSVVEEAGEHVQLFANLSRVNQVKDLHEHEYLEDYGVVKHLLCWFHRFGILWIFDIGWFYRTPI